MESAGKGRDKEKRTGLKKEMAGLSRHLLIYVIDAFDAGGDGGEDFVGDGADGVGEDGGGEVGAEDDGLVALAAVDVGDVDHADVHADVPYVGCLLPVDEAVAAAAAKVAVEAVGIADGQGCDAAVTGEVPFARVAHGLAGGDVVDLQDGSLER